MNRIERLTNEILLLQERGRTSEEIARLLEISKRTVIRDVQALCEMGIPIIAIGGVGGGYSLAGEYSITPLQLTWREAMLMMLALSSISKMSDSPFSEERASLMAKITALLPIRQKERVDEMLSKVEMEVPKHARKAPLLDPLVEIAGTGQWVNMEYDAADGAITLLFRPDRIFSSRGSWYVEGVAEGQTRFYRADRVLKFEAAEPPNDALVPLPYGHQSHPLVQVRLTRRGMRVVERDQHLGQVVAGEKGDNFTLEFRCPPSELDWYSRYFGNLGEDAVVSGPEELVERIRARTAAILKLYS